jgi:hypothetical protein
VHAAEGWDLFIVQGPFSVAPCRTLTLRFATFPSLYAPLADGGYDTRAAGQPRVEAHAQLGQLRSNLHTRGSQKWLE